MAHDPIDAFLTFKNLLEITNQLELAIDKGLSQDDLTARQFKMIATIEKGFDHHPSIKEVAAALKTSHQNVKQMADQLEKRGYLAIERDGEDRRVLRLRTTERNTQFWSERQEEHSRFMAGLFSHLSSEELKELNRSLELLRGGISDFLKS